MAHSKKFDISGMHCASCANVIESTLKATPGIENIEINYGTEQAKLLFDPAKISLESINQKIIPLGYSLLPTNNNELAPQRGQEKIKELASLRQRLSSVLPLAVISILFMTWEIGARFSWLPMIGDSVMNLFHHLLPVMATYTLFIVGQPYLKGLYRFLRYGRANMDTLIGLGTVVAFIYSFILGAFAEELRSFLDVDASYYDVTIVVIAFITLGKYLEMRSKLKTGDAITKLLNLQAKTALVRREDKEVEIPIADVRVGDIIIIKPAGRIPVDGIIIEGSSYIDEALVTGEPIPKEKEIGDEVIAGTINTSGSFSFRATKVGADTMLARIITMVEDAQGSKAPIQALADKISAIFVPIVLGLSVITFALWLIIGTPILGFPLAISYALTSLVGILVIACPCALGLATPTAIIVGVGKGAQNGILIKDAATLEKLHKADVLVADKTGTITKGQPELVDLISLSDKQTDNLLSILAALESKSEHPIATAIIKAAKNKNLTIPPVDNFISIKGHGVKGTVAGRTYQAGNLKLMTDLGLNYDKSSLEIETKKGHTPIFLADEKNILALALVADPIKAEAKEAIKKLHHLGLKLVMLTGDDKNTAEHIAQQVKIDEVIAEALPQDKLDKIQELQAQGLTVIMVGDGINDAPALAQADIGIAMATGTDVAIESAGITLLNGDLSKVAKAVSLSKITMRGIRQNLFWAFIYNIFGIPLAAGAFYPLFGWLLNPAFAGFAMAASSVSVVANSLRLKTKKL